MITPTPPNQTTEGSALTPAEAAPTPRVVAVLGASSLVGYFLIPALQQAGWQVIGWSRAGAGSDLPQVIPYWICLAPLWVFPDYFVIAQRHGARRVVALSSTSIESKQHSCHVSDQRVVEQLQQGEHALRQWAEARGLEWIVLRPTLIYGAGRDRNVSEIDRLIRRFGFFVLLGRGQGLRQPVHAADVALACQRALESTAFSGRIYNVTGGERLTYRSMVEQIFRARGRKPRIYSIPLWWIVWVLRLLHFFPAYRHWHLGMVQRMESDLVFDGTPISRDLSVHPRPFDLQSFDLPDG